MEPLLDDSFSKIKFLIDIRLTYVRQRTRKDVIRLWFNVYGNDKFFCSLATRE
jgi:hypothetical protein